VRSQDEKKDPSIVILDIGCRWGFAEKFLNQKHFGNFKIYGFDPDKEECARLQSFMTICLKGM
jgi:hypothetical protein